MNTSFDPILALIGNHPQIKQSLEEYDNLLRDKTAIVGEIERNQRALGEIEGRISQIVVDFQEKFTIVKKDKPAKEVRKEVKSDLTSSKPPRKLSFAQWMSSVKQSFKHNFPMFAEAGPAADPEFWQEQFEAGAKPGDAAAAWAGRQPAKSLPKKTTASLSQPNPDGPFFPPSKLGITPADLYVAQSLALRAPDEGKDAVIGVPLNTNKGLYAVVLSNVRTSHTVYHLQPVDPDVEGKKRVQWDTRQAQYPKLAPEDVPLAGLYVVDEKGNPYILGADEARIYVEVPNEKAAK